MRLSEPIMSAHMATTASIGILVAQSFFSKGPALYYVIIYIRKPFISYLEASIFFTKVVMKFHFHLLIAKHLFFMKEDVRVLECIPNVWFMEVNRAGRSCWKVGAQFTFLPLSGSNLDQFSKFFFLLKADFNCQVVKKWFRCP